MSKITEEDITKILAALEKAYAQVGKKLETAALVAPGDDTAEDRMLIDNRKETDIN